METLIQVLINRDGMTEDMARVEIEEIRERFYDGEDIEDILRDEYGLEPDYAMDVIYDDY